MDIKEVEREFARAIKRRDGCCVIRDLHPCQGGLECSHFFTRGSSPSLAFYPPNAYSQCTLHHWNHHNRKDKFYLRYMKACHFSDYEYMRGHRHRYIKYTEELKQEIVRLCKADKLDELKILIEKELEK